LKQESAALLLLHSKLDSCRAVLEDSCHVSHPQLARPESGEAVGSTSHCRAATPAYHSYW
jgi:hypothetical protein